MKVRRRISNGPLIAYYAVEDLNLSEVKALQDSYVVAISKHLCGPATGKCPFIALISWDLSAFCLAFSLVRCGHFFVNSRRN